LREGVDCRRASRALAQARTLRYTSDAVRPIGDTAILDGYFELGGGLRFPLDVFAATAMVDYVRHDWNAGRVVHDGTWVIFGGGRWLCAPGDTLDDDAIRDAIERW
jgi:hypothetical protein